MYTRGIKSRQSNGSLKGGMADSNRQWHSCAGGVFLSYPNKRGRGLWDTGLVVVTDVGFVDGEASGLSQSVRDWPSRQRKSGKGNTAEEKKREKPQRHKETWGSLGYKRAARVAGKSWARLIKKMPWLVPWKAGARDQEHVDCGPGSLEKSRQGVAFAISQRDMPVVQRVLASRRQYPHLEPSW